MNSIFILIPVALVFTAIAIRAFFWAVDNNQYDDLDAAGQSILFDDETVLTKTSVKSEDDCSD
ncbi:MAG: cbb3-type cytochrome oxidase maturation protein [Oceanicoccus sp.]|jgi:cbb3-type cytochrome oxidase maturation protein